MSIHRVDIVSVDSIETHPNADALGIVRVGGFTCCVALKDWEPRVPCLAAYIAPDSVVDTTRPEFAWLDDGKGSDKSRIRVKRLRGVYSQGLLIPAPDGLIVGDDAAELLGVTHYEPPLEMGSGAEAEAAPGIFAPTYDVENFNRFTASLAESEEVVATEKIHGANARFAWVDGRLYCGSRGQWKREGKNPWWLAAAKYPAIEAFLQANPDCVLYGEVYGAVQKLKYGVNGVALALFDILRGNQWLGWDESQKIAEANGLPWVPVVARGEFDKDKFLAMAEGNSLIAGAGHIREGIVIKPVQERTDLELGRVQLKMVSNAYLEKN